MTFERAWVLLFLILPIAWTLWELRRTRRTAALFLKAASFVAILLAVAEPKLTIPETKMAVAVLVDTSASVSAQDLARASALATALEKARGRHWVRVLPFARTVRNTAPEENKNGWQFKNTAGEAGSATDLEAAIREAVTSLPSGLVPRLVLISDGKENAGSITRATWQAQHLGIPIDTMALEGRTKPSLRLESVSLPTLAFTGEQFPVDLNVISPEAVSGTVEVRAEGKVLGSNRVALEQGSNQIRVHATLNSAGALNLAGVIRADK
ncbi:MAG TPA: vWA domain-containing protein, partial [Bryobacteraceae bacterium]|nr:vWA domain-containing protein [Bryobacteraceae bacterium]